MKTLALLSLGGLLLATTGCRGSTSKETPIFGIRNMYDQPRYNVQQESDFFPDHRTMRPLVEGVIAREQVVDPVVGQGRLEDQSGYVLEIPREVVTRAGGMEALEQRGRARYGIYCAPCHDNTGNGQGLVTKRAQLGGAAAFAPPTFHQDRIRHMPDGQLFATISNGKNNMPPYAMQIPVDDRWGIVAYVRALEIASPKLAGVAPAADTAAAKTAPAPTTSGSAAPATSGSAAPATSGSAAPATSGSAAPGKGPAAPATSGSAAPGKGPAAPATSGSAAPKDEKKHGGTP